jgi:hypothetical protein
LDGGWQKSSIRPWRGDPEQQERGAAWRLLFQTAAVAGVSAVHAHHAIDAADAVSRSDTMQCLE